MHADLLDKLVCASCGQNGLSVSIFLKNEEEILEGAVWCEHCKFWYPIEDGLLEFLARDLAYTDDRAKFWSLHAKELEALGLKPNEVADKEACVLQRQQQDHFDWYAANTTQTYKDYADTPFWTASDKIAFEPWRRQTSALKC